MRTARAYAKQAPPPSDITAMDLVTMLLETSPMPALVLDGKGRIVANNASARDVLSRYPLDELRRSEVILDEAGEGINLVRRGLETRDGQRFEVLVGKPLDVTASELFDVAVAHWSPTPRQCDVLRGLLEGMSNKEIAERNDCSHRTVEIHVTGLLHRAGVDTRARLVAKARSLAVRQVRPSPKSGPVLRR